MKSFLRGALGAIVVLLIFYFSGCQSGNSGSPQEKTIIPRPSNPLIDSGGSIVILNPVAPTQPRTVTFCKGDTCTLIMAADTGALVPGNNKLLDVVFTSKIDLPANSKIELKIYQRMDTADLMRTFQGKY